MNKNKEKIYKMIEKAYSSKNDLFFIDSLQTISSNHKAKIVKVNRFRNEIEIVSENLDVFSDLITSSGYIYYYIPKSVVVCQSKVINISDNGKLICSFPKEHLILDRRKSERFLFDDHNVFVNFNIASKEIRKQCFDLSESGFSVIFSRLENVNFSEKLDEYDIILEIGQIPIICKTLLISDIRPEKFQLENCPYAYRRVSFTFNHLPFEYSQILKNHLLESNKKIS